MTRLRPRPAARRRPSARPPSPTLDGARPAADRLHQRHRVAAQGRDADPRAVIDQYVSCIVEGEMARDRHVCCTRCRCTTARSSTSSSARRLPGRHQRDHRQAHARQPAAAAAASTGISARSSRHPRCGSRCCARPLFDDDRPGGAAQGLLRRVDHAGGGAARDAASGCRRCGCGTSTARPRSRRWPPCSSPRTSCARRARPGARCSTSRRAWSTTMRDVRPARSARSCTARRSC
jgi:hypothetical protein